MDTAQKRELMIQICNTPAFADSYALYKQFSDELDDCRFIFAATSGSKPGLAVHRDFSAGAAVRSPFNTGRVLVLDKDTLAEMEHKGGTYYRIDYSLSLDTQALSYLEPYLNGQTTRLPKDFAEVFGFIAQDEVNVDPMPYMQENLSSLADQRNAEKVYEKLRAYEVLRTLDSTRLQTRGEVQSLLSETELARRAQNLIAQMYMDAADPQFMSALRLRHQMMYLLLMKMVHIQLGTPKAPTKKKLNQFIQFCDSTLATISVRAIAIARAYFDQGRNLRFFHLIDRTSKEHPGKKNIFDTLENMAWDLLHLLHIEEAICRRPEDARYFFSALLTFDKGLIQIMALCPLRALTFVEGDYMPMPFYDVDLPALISEQQTEQDEFMSLYSEEAILSRNQRRPYLKEHINDAVLNLKSELAKVAGTPE